MTASLRYSIDVSGILIAGIARRSYARTEAASVAAIDADRFADLRPHDGGPLQVVSLQFGVKSWLTIASFAGRVTTSIPKMSLNL
jgi:hypothetical protein